MFAICNISTAAEFTAINIQASPEYPWYLCSPFHRVNRFLAIHLIIVNSIAIYTIAFHITVSSSTLFQTCGYTMAANATHPEHSCINCSTPAVITTTGLLSWGDWQEILSANDETRSNHKSNPPSSQLHNSEAHLTMQHWNIVMPQCELTISPLIKAHAHYYILVQIVLERGFFPFQLWKLWEDLIKQLTRSRFPLLNITQWRWIRKQYSQPYPWHRECL